MTIEIPVIPFDEQKTDDAAGKKLNGASTNGKTKTKKIPTHTGTGSYTPYKS